MKLLSFTTGLLSLLLSFGVAEAKEVLIPYDDFLRMVSKVEHSEKLRNKAMAENGVLVKLKDEHQTVIKLQAEQIKACESMVKDHEKLGETEAQISKALEARLEEEKRLSRYKSEFVGLAVVGVILWLIN